MQPDANMQAASNVIKKPDGSVSPATKADHQRLLAKVAEEGDRDAFREIFAYFGPRLKTVMLKAGADPATADDLVQDVMMTVWRKVDLYAPHKGAVSTWIFTIARNARIDWHRRGASQPYDDLDDLELASDEGDGETETFVNQRCECVAAAMNELPDDQRKIIECAFVEDLSQSEISERLAIPLGTVKSRMRLAYAKLKERLEALK